MHCKVVDYFVVAYVMVLVAPWVVLQTFAGQRNQLVQEENSHLVDKLPYLDVVKNVAVVMVLVENPLALAAA